MGDSRFFDRRIASTWTTAQPSDEEAKFIVSVFATCGKAPVLLEGNEFSANCNMWLTGGSLHLDFEGCYVSLNNEKLVEGAPTFLQQSSAGNLKDHSQNDPTKVGFSVSATKGELSADLEHSFAQRNSNQTQFTEYSRHRLWDVMGPQDIILGVDSSALQGMIVPGIAGWTIEMDPKANRTAVTARMHAQQEFCKFELLPATTVGGRVSRKIWTFFSTATTRERQMFSALLERLAALGLVANEMNTAFLAEHTLLIDKERMPKFEPVSAFRHSETFKISIDTQPLSQFVDAGFSERSVLLESYGIQIERFIDKVQMSTSTPRDQTVAEDNPRRAAGQFIANMIDQQFSTKKEAAVRMNVSQSMLSNILAGRRKVSADLADRLSELLGQDSEFFLDLETQTPIPNPALEPKQNRRKRSVSYDFLLLEALSQRLRYGYPVGQETLFELASHLDDTSKKPSLVSKLNRWRNDKKWVEWGDPEDVRLTDAGKNQRDRLLQLVQREGSIDVIKDTFLAVWNIEVDF